MSRSVNLMSAALFLAMATLPLSVGGQVQRPQTVEPQKTAEEQPAPRLTPAEIKELLQYASSVPPEFRSDALVRIAHALPEADRERKIGLLKEAFEAAAQTPHDFPRAPADKTHLGLPGERWSFTEMNRASREAIVISLMADLDMTTALQMYDQLLRLRPAKAACDADWVDDTEPIYNTAVTLFRHMKDPAKIAEFMTGLLQRAESEAQMARLPLTLTDLPASLSREQLSGLSDEFGAALQRASGDDQAFTVYERFFNPRFRNLLAVMARRNISTQSLLTQYQSYMRSHFNSSRCRVNTEGQLAAMELMFLQEQGPSFGLSVDDEPKAFLESMAKPVDQPDLQMGESFPQDELFVEAHKILEAEIEAGGIEERKDPNVAVALTDRINRFLDKIETPAGLQDNDNLDLYKTRCSVATNILTYMPAGPVRERALAVLIHLVGDSPVYQRDRREWFFDVATIVDSVKVAEKPEEILEQIKKTDNPVLLLYAKLMEKHLA